MSNRLDEMLKPVAAIVPIDTTGAGQDGDWVSLKNYRRCLIIIMQGAWAGGTSAVTVEQATSAAGGSAKALTIEYYNQGTALTDDAYARTAISSNTFNLPATANTFTFLEVHQQDLDMNNGFCFIRVRTATPGANADLIAAVYVLGEPAYAMKAADLPTAIA